MGVNLLVKASTELQHLSLPGLQLRHGIPAIAQGQLWTEQMALMEQGQHGSRLVGLACNVYCIQPGWAGQWCSQEVEREQEKMAIWMLISIGHELQSSLAVRL